MGTPAASAINGDYLLQEGPGARIREAEVGSAVESAPLEPPGSEAEAVQGVAAEAGMSSMPGD